VGEVIPKLNVLNLVRLRARAVSAKKEDKSPCSSKNQRNLTPHTHQAAECPKRKCKNCREEVRLLLANEWVKVADKICRAMMPWNAKKVSATKILIVYMFTDAHRSRGRPNTHC
jgi:hypothetical protein